LPQNSMNLSVSGESLIECRTQPMGVRERHLSQGSSKRKFFTPETKQKVRLRVIEVKDDNGESTFSNHSLIQYVIISRGEKNV
jgi:hypothetical protein